MNNPLGNLRLRFRLLKFKDQGLKNAPRIMSKNLKGGLSEIGKRLARSARSRMRKDVGTEQKSLKVVLQGQGLNLNVLIFSTLVQAFVDAYGLPRGVFPDFAINSGLYGWAKRRLKGLVVKQVKTGKSSPAGPAKPRELRNFRQRRRTHIAKRSKITKHNVSISTKRRVRSKANDFRRLAFLVARSIYQRGIKPTFWNQRALDANKNMIQKALQNALSRAATEMKRV
jgi:hypothetical protein